MDKKKKIIFLLALLVISGCIHNDSLDEPKYSLEPTLNMPDSTVVIETPILLNTPTLDKTNTPFYVAPSTTPKSTAVLPLLTPSSMSEICQAQPTINLDSMLILFVANWDNSSDIYLIRANGNDLFRLTTSAEDDILPAWSSDGKQIAYVSKRVSDGFGLYTMKADGSQKTLLSPSSIQIGKWSFPTRLSPNSKFVHPNDDKIINWFSWSPDDQYIAFRGANNNSSHIYITELDTGSTIDMLAQSRENGTWAPDVRFGYSLSWSPDSQFIAFDAPLDAGGNYLKIHIAKLDGEFLEYLDINSNWTSFIQWHPEDELILSISEFSQDQLIVLKPDGTDQKVLAEVDGSITKAIWSPNGVMIAYDNIKDQIDEYGRREIVTSNLHILDKNDANQSDIFGNLDIKIQNFSWAPDNRNIALIVNEDGVLNLYIVDICSRSLTLLVENVSDDAPSWKP